MFLSKTYKLLGLDIKYIFPLISKNVYFYIKTFKTIMFKFTYDQNIFNL